LVGHYATMVSMSITLPSQYTEFVFFSAGPVGDHAVQIDFANRFFESTGTPSTLIMKHPNAFLHDLAIPYNDHVQHLDFVGWKGVLKMSKLALMSVFQRNCYVLIFPIPAPTYLKLFSYYIRFCTRSRIVGFNLEGSKSFPVGKGYVSFLGKANILPMLPEMFYLSANRMLSFLGFKDISHTPELTYVMQESLFEKLSIVKKQYIAFHVSPSHSFRSLPADRWNKIISSVMTKFPEIKIVFTGAKADIPFIQECIVGLPYENICIAAGKTNTQELLTLYANARVDVVVQTGNALLTAMLHTHSVVVNIKGTAMFYYDFNENATILFSEKDCICDPFETHCNMVSYKDKEYMACMFNISDEQIIQAISDTYSKA
jgi:ADP-heptose:LPS heptosyltransferase